MTALSNIVALKGKKRSGRSIENGKVAPPKRQKSKDLRSQKQLTSDLVDWLMRDLSRADQF